MATDVTAEFHIRHQVVHYTAVFIRRNLQLRRQNEIVVLADNTANIFDTTDVVCFGNCQVFNHSQ